MLAFLVSPLVAQTYTLRVLAGLPATTGLPFDGPGTQAQFARPTHLAIDGAGGLYVADEQAIRRVATDGTVTTLMDTLLSARLATALAADRQGNLYLANTTLIRKRTAGGTWSILAGAEQAGYVDGTGATVRFAGIGAITCDPDGNVYVLDVGNHAIRKVTPAGVVSSLASGGEGNYPFQYPQRIAADGAGNVYVTDWQSPSLHRISAAGIVAPIELTDDPAAPADARSAFFSRAESIAVDGQGNLFVTDADNVVRKITPQGRARVFAGVPGQAGVRDGNGTAARFSGIAGIAIDSAGTVYVSELPSRRIRKITVEGGVTTLAGRPPGADGVGYAARFGETLGLAAAADGVLYVADTDSHTIRRVQRTGEVETIAGSPFDPGLANGRGDAARFNQPAALAVDDARNVYISDTENAVIRRLTPDGTVSTFAGSTRGYADGASYQARFYTPIGITVDRAGDLWVADGGGAWHYHQYPRGPAPAVDTVTLHNNVVRRIAGGMVSTLAGVAEKYGTSDGRGADARFASPFGLTLDGGGDLIVSDGVSLYAHQSIGPVDWTQLAVNAAVRRITSAGDVTTVAGSATGGYVEGPRDVARFATPRGVAVDRAGNILVADTLNGAIRRIDPAGNVTTLPILMAGEATEAITAAATAALREPRALAFDGDGNLYVAAKSVIFKGGPPAALLGPTVLALGHQERTRGDGGLEITLSVRAAGEPAPGYQWRKDGVAIAGATRATHLLSPVQPGDAGRYSVAVTNAAGVATSAEIVLGAPVFTTSPSGFTVAAEENVSLPLAVAVSSVPAATLQWLKDGVAIAGATGQTLAVARRESAAGKYTVAASNLFGPAVSGEATVSIPGLPVADGVYPLSLAGIEGGGGNLWAFAKGEPPLDIQWRRSETVVGSGREWRVNALRISDAGRYTYTVSNARGRVTSEPIDVSVVGQPTFQGARALTVFAGQPVQIAVPIAGVTPPLQWRRNGYPLAGATAAGYSIAAARLVDGGDYVVRVGEASTSAARLTVLGAPTAAQQPLNSAGVKVLAGYPATFSAPAGTSGMSFQWTKNGVAIPGATQSTFTVVSTQPEDAGDYALAITSLDGAPTSWPIRLSVEPTARIVNLSTRATVGPDQKLITGFVLSDGTVQPMLLRAVGPGLGLVTSGARLAGDPRLELYRAGALLATNDNWNESAADVFARAGAFPLSRGSFDAALTASLSGAHTAQMSVVSAGAALLEIYDMGSPLYDPNSERRPPRLLNVSARHRVSRSDPLIAGFVVAGVGRTTLLIRAVGPTLAGAFGVTGAVADPRLEIFDRDQRKVAESDDWASELGPSFVRAGAFPFPAGSKDSAVVVTVAAGTFTAVLSPVTETVGEALIEVYELPDESAAGR